MSEIEPLKPNADGKFSAADGAVAVLLGLIAIPICEAGWHAIVTNDHPDRGWVAVVIGVPLGIAGITFHWWKKYLPEVGKTLQDAALWLWPVSLVLAFLYFAGPVLYERLSHLSVQNERPISVAEKDAITAPLRSQIKTLTDELNKERQQHTAATSQSAPQKTSAPKSKLNADEIALNIEVWKSIGQKTNELVIAINDGYAFLDNWPAALKSDRKRFLATLDGYPASIQRVQNELETMRVSYLNYSDVSTALDQTKYVRSPVPVTVFDKLIYSTKGFWRAVNDLPEPLPQDYENRLRVFAGAMRRDINALSQWELSLNKTAALKERELLNIGAK